MDTGTATIIAAGIAAGVAAITSIISTIFTWHSIKVTKAGNEKNLAANKDIANLVQKEENIRAEFQIDADITWNARVEWIQNVRRVTAEFITACYKFIHSIDCDKDEQNRNLELIQEKKSLLILYFGPDGIEDGQKKAQDICDRSTNDAKNDMIVALINKLFDQLKAYFLNESEYKRYHTELVKCIACENSEDGKKISCEKDFFEGEIIYFTEDDCKIFQEEFKKGERSCFERRNDLFNNINLLTEAMRIYLKLEWNKTKNRKK